MARKITNVDDARLLPRLRKAVTPLSPEWLDRARMERQQAKVLMAALDANPDAVMPLRHALTKPGDSEQLRGLPAIAKGVSGVSPGTDPMRALLRKESRRERSGL